MNFIENNPFRILDLPINAGEREIAKQVNKLATLAEMGKKKSFENDFSFLVPIERTPNIIEEAKKQLEQNESKFLYSLFWFWKNNSVDDLAFEVLKEGNTDKALSIWEKSALSNKHKVYKPVVIVDNLIRESRSWSEQKDEKQWLTKSLDEYIVDRKETELYSIHSVAAPLKFEENWTIECDTDWKAGVDNYAYGIVFGRNDSSFFSFQISGNGHYSYVKYLDWSATTIIDWEEHNSIKKTSTNHIKISKVDNKITLIINGSIVNTVEAEPFFGQSCGFKVNSKQKISFKNFKLCLLVEDIDCSYGDGINVTPKNFSSIKNLSTLYLSLSILSQKNTFKFNHFEKGISLAKFIFSSEEIEVYSKLIAGDRYVYNSEKTLQFYINEVLDSLKNYIEKPKGISSTQIIGTFSTFPLEAKRFLNNRFVAKQIQNIDLEIEKAAISRKNSASTAAAIGKKLISVTKEDILYLKTVLGENDFQYQLISDKLASEIVQCGIDTFNSCKDSEGEIDFAKAIKSEEAYIHEYTYAQSIAVTERAKEKASENLVSCKEWIAKKHLYDCWFCATTPSEAASLFSITIYNVTKRDVFGVEYQYIDVNIPRCHNCKKFHRYFFKPKPIQAPNVDEDLWFLGLLILLFSAIIYGISYIFGHFIFWSVRKILKVLYPINVGIKNTSLATVSKYPKIRKLLFDGWQFSKPTT